MHAAQERVYIAYASQSICGHPYSSHSSIVSDQTTHWQSLVKFAQLQLSGHAG